MNGEPRTDLIQLITRTESLSGDDDSQARPADVDASPWRLMRVNLLPSSHMVAERMPS